MKTNHPIAALTTLLALIFVFPLTASHATIIGGVTATASSTFVGAPPFNFDLAPIHAVDGSGLNAGDNSAVTADQTQPQAAASGTQWLSSSTGFGGLDSAPWFQANLGAVYNVAGVRIFNDNEPPQSNTRGVHLANLLVSPDGNTYTPVGSLDIPMASGDGTDVGTYFDFAALFNGPVSGQYFKLNIQSGWGSVGVGPFYGLSELQFEQVAPIPEPSTLLLLGVGGLLLWRKKLKLA